MSLQTVVLDPFHRYPAGTWVCFGNSRENQRFYFYIWSSEVEELTRRENSVMTACKKIEKVWLTTIEGGEFQYYPCKITQTANFLKGTYSFPMQKEFICTHSVFRRPSTPDTFLVQHDSTQLPTHIQNGVTSRLEFIQRYKQLLQVADAPVSRRESSQGPEVPLFCRAASYKTGQWVRVERGGSVGWDSYITSAKLDSYITSAKLLENRSIEGNLEEYKQTQEITLATIIDGKFKIHPCTIKRIIVMNRVEDRPDVCRTIIQCPSLDINFDGIGITTNPIQVILPIEVSFSLVKQVLFHLEHLETINLLARHIPVKYVPELIGEYYRE